MIVWCQGGGARSQSSGFQAGAACGDKHPSMQETAMGFNWNFNGSFAQTYKLLFISYSYIHELQIQVAFSIKFVTNLTKFWKLKWDAITENLDTLKTKLFVNISKCDTRYLQCQDMKLMCDLCNWSEQPTGRITDPVIWRNNNNYFRSDRFPAIWRRSQSINWQYFNTKM